MSKRVYWNEGWLFEKLSDEGIESDQCEKIPVRIPHTTKELPFHYFDEHEYQMLCEYEKEFVAPVEWQDKNLLLSFDGVGHDSEVFLNGISIGTHHCGYTAFTVSLNDAIKIGEKNVLKVRVDSRENLNIPPFGFVIDYMTYGGIYRDVYLDIKEKSYIEDIFIKTKIGKDGEQSKVISDIVVHGDENVNGLKIRQFIREYGEKDFKQLSEEFELNSRNFENGENDENDANIENEDNTDKKSISLTQITGKIKLWDVDEPNLYELKTELLLDEKIIDEKVVRYGYRKAIFKKNGFYLNGRKLKIRGLNRHQSYAYTGYAMPESMQKLDADILKKELGLNAVRTSHYPQSHYFLDRCDELGLLVFTEIPGWQHIGNDEWKEQAVKNVEDMILQYRNHTSIILWGVRINESVDDDEFYTKTNEVARRLDPTRQTGGVRCYKKSNLLEDVYTYNDFSHEGDNKGCDNKASVTSNNEKPYLISEYNGHMFPTKAFDWEEKRNEHALRHATVLNDVAKAEDIAGSFGWCMFDYNTHKDFGSGDRICYHGVMDMFRNPKLAAAVYKSQQDEIPVLEISTSMDIGEHPGCNRGDAYIYTNADSVKMYKNGVFIKEYCAGDSKYNSLAHGPILIDDYIGDTLRQGENMSQKQADTLKDLLNQTARTGLYRMPKSMYVKALGLIALYHMKLSDATELYNKYVGDWGGTSTEYRFEAIKDGDIVATKVLKPMTKVNIKAEADHTDMIEKISYDVAAIRISATDENGNILRFCNDPVKLSVSGNAELIGPELVCLSGGMGGTYIKTIGKGGTANLKIETAEGIETNISFTISVNNEEVTED